MEEKQALTKQYKSILMKEEGYADFSKIVNIDGYCECMALGFYKTFTAKEIHTDPDINSDPRMQLLSDSCAQLNAK